MRKRTSSVFSIFCCCPSNNKNEFSFSTFCCFSLFLLFVSLSCYNTTKRTQKSFFIFYCLDANKIIRFGWRCEMVFWFFFFFCVHILISYYSTLEQNWMANRKYRIERLKGFHFGILIFSHCQFHNINIWNRSINNSQSYRGHDA